MLLFSSFRATSDLNCVWDPFLESWMISRLRVKYARPPLPALNVRPCPALACLSNKQDHCWLTHLLSKILFGQPLQFCADSGQSEESKLLTCLTSPLLYIRKWTWPWPTTLFLSSFPFQDQRVCSSHHTCWMNMQFQVVNVFVLVCPENRFCQT